METRKRVFFANIAEFDAMMQWVRENLSSLAQDQAFVKQFTLALEEALVNIIQYAYNHPPGLIEIECQLEKEKGKVSFALRDEGVAFNPLVHKSATSEQSIEERKEGGLGIFFMKKMTDAITYERIQDANVLVLTKNLSA